LGPCLRRGDVLALTARATACPFINHGFFTTRAFPPARFSSLKITSTGCVKRIA
jgi:hypothetical protein